LRDIWDRIEAQFRNHAPGQLWCLKPGATEEQIVALESEIGRKLPEDIRKSFAIHNGVDGFTVPTGPPPNGFDALLDLHLVGGSVAMGRELSGDGYGDWGMGWVPIIGEGTGDYLCIDLDPPEGGSVGQVFEFAHEYGAGQILFPDFRGYLEQYAADLESGAIRFDGNYWIWSGDALGLPAAENGTDEV
jgi:cell wall assembly regulator SMI1